MANKHLCSDGSKVSEATIQKKYSDSLRNKHSGESYFICKGCGTQAVHNDHTIAKARCKVIHKTELIWDHDNFESSCAQCHSEWENLKSDLWMNHQNVERRLLFLKNNDPEGYNIRMSLTKQ